MMCMFPFQGMEDVHVSFYSQTADVNSKDVREPLQKETEEMEGVYVSFYSQTADVNSRDVREPLQKEN